MDADSHGDKRPTLSLSKEICEALAHWMREQTWHRNTKEEASFHACAHAQIGEGSSLIWLQGEQGATYSLPLLVEHTPSVSPGDSSPIYQSESLCVRDACTCFSGQKALGTLLGLDSSYSRHFPEGAGQTNTSIRYENGEGAVILKIFRTFAPGHERDFLLTSLLAEDNENAALVPGDPRALCLREGAITGDTQVRSGEVVLGFSHRYIPSESTGWDVLQTVLPLGQRARLASIITSLGTFTAHLHKRLAQAGSCEVDSTLSAHMRDRWRTRATQAVQTVPALDVFEGMAEMTYAACAHVRWPRIQLIHGDYHLGQVLFTDDASWIAVDFEGEPIDSINDPLGTDSLIEADVHETAATQAWIEYSGHRLGADLPLRDVAGMLRSFHYVWFVVAQANPRFTEAFPFEEFRDFVAENFFLGYGTPSDEEQVLLDALLIDKALYEVRYETLYRPSWVHIPLKSIPYLAK